MMLEAMKKFQVMQIIYKYDYKMVLEQMIKFQGNANYLKI